MECVVSGWREGAVGGGVRKVVPRGGRYYLLLGFYLEKELGFFSAPPYSIYGDEKAVVDEVGDPVSDGGGADPKELGHLLRGEGDHRRAGLLQGDVGHEAQMVVEGQDFFGELAVST